MPLDEESGASEASAAALRCSIVIPAYNAGRYIRTTLKSVLAQSVTAWEVLVVDDGSTDDTVAQVHGVGDPRIRVVTQANAGPSAARNRGMAAARGPCVLFLDADDFLLDEALARLLAPLEAQPDLVASYGESVVADAAGHPVGTARPPVFNARPSGAVLRSLVARNFVITGTICVRATALASAGTFRSDLRVGEDWEYWCRLAALGPFQYIGGPPVMAYRQHAVSQIRTAGLAPAAILRSVEAIFENTAIHTALGGGAARLRRQALAAAYSFTANEQLRSRNWPVARGLLVKSIACRPLQAREWILLVLAGLHWMPPAVARRLK